MIKMQIIGHLGRDCSQSEVGGKNVINFPVAHSEKYKDAQGNLVEKTVWVNCAYWTDKTGIAPYLVKGQLVYAEGTPDSEAYTNKDNQLASSLRLRVSNIQLLGGRADNSGSSSDGNQKSAPENVTMPPSAVPDSTDDLPF